MNSSIGVRSFSTLGPRSGGLHCATKLSNIHCNEKKSVIPLGNMHSQATVVAFDRNAEDSVCASSTRAITIVSQHSYVH